jgi:spermidine synthase
VSTVFICIVFFLSGISALTYQLAWQRKLFTIFGTNIESITVVVTAFMMGLGLGSLAGGLVSEKRFIRVLPAFAFIELCIGAYGLVSMRIFDAVSMDAQMSTMSAGLLSFALVLVPTVLMGATLPLLVVHLVRKNSNVGESVGFLYFANTVGAAAGAFLCALVLFKLFGLSGSVHFAAALNLLSALLIAVAAWREA